MKNNNERKKKCSEERKKKFKDRKRRKMYCVFPPAFGCYAHPKAGQNTQQK